MRGRNGFASGENAVSVRGRDIGAARALAIAISACAAAIGASAAECGPASAPEPAPSELAGFVTVKTGGATRVISIGSPTPEFRAIARWHVTGRVVIENVTPLWRAGSGDSLANAPAYRGRRFTADGDLVGKPIDMVVSVELWAISPRIATGIEAAVYLDEFVISAHKYQTRWGAVQSVDERPSELGRVPPQRLVVRSGFLQGVSLSVREDGGAWAAKAERQDVVRLANCAFGMSCSYRARLACYGRGQTETAEASAAAPDAACVAALALAAAR